MHVIAGASPDNTPAGYYWTFLFPMLLFIVIALILWALFGRPHQRVPAGRITLGLSVRSAAAGPSALATSAVGPVVAGGADEPTADSLRLTEPGQASDAGDGRAGRPGTHG